MAESSLTLGYPELRQAVGYFLRYGSVIDSWSATQITAIEAIVQTGYRRVLYPAAGPGHAGGYEWSFLRPTTTLAIVADDGDYDLPDDYGRIVGNFHYAPVEYLAAIIEVPLSNLLNMRTHSDRNGSPNFFATRFKSSDGTDGQRQEVLFYAEPDEDRTLYYSYDAFTGKLTNAAPYPLGGMSMSELYKESCLAVAESRDMDEIGIHTALFQSLLVDAIARDQKKGSMNYGRIGNPYSSDGQEPWRRGSKLHDGAYEITYHGEYL